MKNISIYSLFAIIIFLSCNSETEVVTLDAPVDDSTLISPAGNAANSFRDSTLSDAVFDDGSIPTSWENAGITDPAAFIAFFTNLQQWIAEEKKDSIANHINFPLRKVKSREEFIKNYQLIFNDEIRKKIANQNKRQIFRNQNGVMIAEGAIWINEQNKKFIITALNFQLKKQTNGH